MVVLVRISGDGRCRSRGRIDLQESRLRYSGLLLTNKIPRLVCPCCVFYRWLTKCATQILRLSATKMPISTWSNHFQIVLTNTRLIHLFRALIEHSLAASSVITILTYSCPAQAIFGKGTPGYWDIVAVACYSTQIGTSNSCFHF